MTVISDMIGVLDLLRKHPHIPTPMVSASEDEGEVFFYWNAGTHKVSMSIEGDGFMGYATYRNGSFKAGPEDVQISSGLPDDLVAYFKEYPA